MSGDAAWQLNLRAGPAGSGILVIGLGGAWRLELGLPAADTLDARLDASVREVCFDADQLAGWDSGLLSFVAG